MRYWTGLRGTTKIYLASEEQPEETFTAREWTEITFFELVKGNYEKYLNDPNINGNIPNRVIENVLQAFKHLLKYTLEDTLQISGATLEDNYNEQLSDITKHRQHILLRNQDAIEQSTLHFQEQQVLGYIIDKHSQHRIDNPSMRERTIINWIDIFLSGLTLYQLELQIQEEN